MLGEHNMAATQRRYHEQQVLLQKKRERSAEIFKSRLERETVLGDLVKRMFTGLIEWNKANKVSNTTSWSHIFSMIDRDHSGRLRFEELVHVVCDLVSDHLEHRISKYELCMIWRHFDEDGSGEVTVNEFALFVYRVELSTWPILTQQEITRIVKVMNTAAHYWHHSGGNWYKIFVEMDTDGNGQVSFDELRKSVRGPFPGLRLLQKDISDRELTGFWKAMDSAVECEVSVAKFLTFMRKYGGDLSMHRHAPHPQKKQNRKVKSSDTMKAWSEDPQQNPNCPKEKLCEIIQKFESALSAHWSEAGVHQDTTSTWYGTSLGIWDRFFKELQFPCNRALTFDSLNDAVARTLGQRSLTAAEVKCLWEYLSTKARGRTGEVTAKNVMFAMYCLELAEWPCLDEASLLEVVNIMNKQAHRKQPGAQTGQTNWSKLWLLADPGGAGHVGFLHVKTLIRRKCGLCISQEKMDNSTVRGLWKALDVNLCGSVNGAQFMAFMRRFGDQHHKHLSWPGVARPTTGESVTARDVEAEIMAAPAFTEAELLEVGKKLTVKLQSILSCAGPGISGLWAQLVKETGKTRVDKVTYEEFEAAVFTLLRMGSRVSVDEVKALWRYMDVGTGGFGEISAGEINGGLYRLGLSQWPRLCDFKLRKIVCILNAAADHWHRCGGNWFKVFVTVDEDGSGNLSFEEFHDIVRKNFPGLSVSSKDVTSSDLRGLWRALDSNCLGLVGVNDFMSFMRRYGEDCSMHKPTEYSKLLRSDSKKIAVEAAKARDLPPVTRSPEQLRNTIKVLEKALKNFWSRRGISVSSFLGGWEEFFHEATLVKRGRNSRLVLTELQRLLHDRLGGHTGHRKLETLPTTSDSTLQEMPTPTTTSEEWRGSDDIVKGVSLDDLRALWTKVDADGSGEMSIEEWTLGLYRTELEFWPSLSDAALEKAVSKMNDAAEKWHKAGGNWYKVFTILDTDSSGNFDFNELRGMIRKPLPCLAISVEVLDDASLQGLWKALDADQSGSVTVQEFMRFMRQYGVGQQARDNGNKSKVNRTSRVTNASLHTSSFDTMEDVLGDQHIKQLSGALASLSWEHVKDFYQQKNKPFEGKVEELEWLRMARELLGFQPAEIEDKAIHQAWCIVDPDGFGEVNLQQLLEFQKLVADQKAHFGT